MKTKEKKDLVRKRKKFRHIVSACKDKSQHRQKDWIVKVKLKYDL